MEPPNNQIKIIITEDIPLFRTGVRNALSNKKDLSIIGEAENGVDLLQKLEYLRPDIILLNIQMPVMDGLTALPILKKKYPGIKVIILSMHNDPTIICRTIELGANSYLTKEAGSEKIYEAILACHQNWFFISDTVKNAIINQRSESQPELTFTFSTTEIRILRFLQKGKKEKEIAEKVDLSPRTVEAIIGRLKTKTGSQSTEELITRIPKDASKLSTKDKTSIKSKTPTLFNKFKAAFVIIGVVTVFFIPRIVKGLTPVTDLTEKIYEKSKYKFDGSVCNDGHISHSQGRGTCSWHGGVHHKFYKGDYSKTREECKAQAIKLSWRD